MLNFTPEDLLRYLYNETAPEETTQIKAALESDWSLREKLAVIISGQERLEALKLSPSQHILDNIASYAEKAIVELSTEA